MHSLPTFLIARYMEEQFESIVRDESILKEWDESLISIFTKKLSGRKDKIHEC